ncbi:hypothetical protein AB9T89_15270 [Flavobacterium oncorhynchi]|uniref:hypothetical protein n=1 Tax=Flavobacterium oncorhynchi TaxID=728056 RepID=UPI00351A5CFE
MLKTILNFKGVEVLSVNELKHTVGGLERCIVSWSPYPYNGPCIMLPPLEPAEPREPICRATIDGIECE